MQLFEALPRHIEDALRASIQRFGVLVPVVTDQHGATLDGHHRRRIADDLGVKYRVDVVQVADEDEARDLARTLNADRRQLTEDQRREVAVHLRQQGHSLRAIGGALGISHEQARQDIEAAATVNDLTVPDRVTGLDGKSRPSRRPTLVAAKDEREAERAQQALAVLDGQAPAKVLDVRRVERIAREHAAEQRRQQPVDQTTVRAGVEIRLGDFCKVLADLEPGSVNAIITDPPYPVQFWPLYQPLGELARRILRVDGVLAVMTGTRLEMLDAVDQSIGGFMRRRHRGVYLTPGPRWRNNLERVAIGYKPILIYAHPDSTPDQLAWINDDVFGSVADDKNHHHWGQSESGFASIVDRLTSLGQLVVDPFLGGGTTAVVCRDLGRRFIGCDVDPAAVATARDRLG